MDLEELIRDLASHEGILWVVGGGEVVSENVAREMREPEFSDGYATVQANSWHFHIRAASVAGVQFVRAEDHGVPYLYYARFSDASSETLLRVYFPNPHLDEEDQPTEFQPDKLRFFEGFRDRYVGREGITYVERPRQDPG